MENWERPGSVSGLPSLLPAYVPPETETPNAHFVHFDELSLIFMYILGKH